MCAGAKKEEVETLEDILGRLTIFHPNKKAGPGLALPHIDLGKMPNLNLGAKGDQARRGAAARRIHSAPWRARRRRCPGIGLKRRRRGAARVRPAPGDLTHSACDVHAPQKPCTCHNATHPPPRSTSCCARARRTRR